ncbi:MAG: hypothetical protein H7245_06060 [Candidatus Saccharibacteria bacterium]|nr:hypothetical protein [Pseudorhodobacter sp.]
MAVMATHPPIDCRGQTVADTQRGEFRLRTRLRARLISRMSDDRVVLINLSQRGCCVEIRKAIIGRDAILKWGSYEVYGAIAWQAEPRLGLVFDRPIP